MPLKLNVPFAERESAKKLGAFWDADNKVWFVPNHKDYNAFIKWIDIEQINIIIKAPLYVGKNSRICWRCKNQTTVISLYATDFYTLEDLGDEDDIFYKVDAKSFLSEVKYLDLEMSNFIKLNFPFFKIGFSKTINDFYWSNHCEHCDALQGDFYNHAEPGGAFCPVTEDECKAIELIKLSFKYDVEMNGGYSWSSNEDEIFNLAKKLEWDNYNSTSKN